jgi:CRP/FNR family cyclic AMP-dependent transcriptional regulator
MTDEELINSVLRISSITAELRDWEKIELGKGASVHEYKAGTYLFRPGKSIDDNSLNILASGEAEVFTLLDNDLVKLTLLKPGDLAGIITFVGGNLSQISATVVTKTDCKILRLDRGFIESLLTRQPAIVILVLQGIVRQLHGIVRHLNVQTIA